MSFVSLYSYINPVIAVIAVVLGVAILGEPLTARMIAAAALVLTGAAIVKTHGGPTESQS